MEYSDLSRSFATISSALQPNSRYRPRPLISNDLDKSVAFSSSDSAQLTYGSAEGTAAAARNATSRTDAKDRITLAWKNVRVEAKCMSNSPNNQVYDKLRRMVQKNRSVSNHTVVELLHGIDGVVEPGNMLAVMGPSGAGKSTMLNALSGRLDRATTYMTTGKISHNGCSLGVEAQARIGACVPQQDCFIGYVTVWEHLWFEARLRLTTWPHEQIRRRVLTVINELGLQGVMHSQIGVPGVFKTLSGGERKRLAFATEVLSNPSLLFCDEPTSGLDSFMSYTVGNVLRSLADAGKTIVCTIHCPSSDTFRLFDKLLLLSDGDVAYFGPTEQLNGFFESLQLPCNIDFNLADHALALISDELIIRKEQQTTVMRDYTFTDSNMYGREASNTKPISTTRRVIDGYRNSSIRKQMTSHVDAKIVPFDQSNEGELLEKCTFKQAGIVRQIAALTSRSWKSFYRTPAFVRSRVFQTVAYTTMFALTFWQQQYNQRGAMALSGLMYQMQMMVTWDNLDAYSISIPAELAVFRRDQQRRLYTPTWYFLSKSCVEIPFLVGITTLQISVIYLAAHLRYAFDAWFYCVLAEIFTAMTSVSAGYVISFASDDIAIQVSIKRCILVPMCLFAGFYVVLDNIPPAMRWMRYLSFFMYTGTALNVNQWHEVDSIACDPIPNAAAAASSNATDVGLCFDDGDDLLRYFGFNPDASVPLMLLILFIYIVILRVAALVILITRTRRYLN